MNSDDIVSDIISLIHSTTQLNYIKCSEVSSKLFSYLSQIELNDNSWNEFHQALRKYNENIHHPDLQLFQQLIQIISQCSNDFEERNYTLGRDENTLKQSIYDLRKLLKSHVDLNCFSLKKLIEKQDIRHYLIDIMNLTEMNVGNDIHETIFDIIYLLGQIDSTFFVTHVIDHTIVINAIRIIEMNHLNSKDENNISALKLLTESVLTNESFPIQTNSHITSHDFIRSLFESIENSYHNEELERVIIKFLLSFNLRFDYPNENPLILTLMKINQEFGCRKLIERLIFLFNRNIDPVEKNQNNSIVKFFSDLYDEEKCLNDILLSDSDRHLIIEILIRELTNRSCTDQITTIYLSLLELILRHYKITMRIEDIQACFSLYLSSEHCPDENRYIINEIIRQHPYLSFE